MWLTRKILSLNKDKVKLKKREIRNEKYELEKN
jgi:hypothetical protein